MGYAALREVSLSYLISSNRKLSTRDCSPDRTHTSMLARWEQVFDLTVLGELGWVYWVHPKQRSHN